MIEMDIVIPEEKPKKSKKTWHNVNDIKESEVKPYKKEYHPLNPFRMEDKVLLRIQDHKRFNLIEGITPNMVGSISEVLGNNMVNIAYWDTKPSVIKNVPVQSVFIAKNNSLKVKLRVLFIKLLRKFKDPEKLPKKIQEEISDYWG